MNLETKKVKLEKEIKVSIQV